MTHLGHFLFWWEWVDSNHLRLKPTDLQSAPALQLRRTPRTLFFFCPPSANPCGPPYETLAKCGAGSGTRTRTSSLEGLRTSPCTMPAINPRANQLYTNLYQNQVEIVVRTRHFIKNTAMALGKQTLFMDLS